MKLPARLPVLDRKLVRDLWEMKGQALAIVHPGDTMRDGARVAGRVAP